MYFSCNSVTVSSRGYTDNEIGVEYLKDYHEQTKHLEGTRFLFVDGHRSHCTLQFLEFAVEHNIIVISTPPHTTHELQGLDVACFGALKIYWEQECREHMRATGKAVNNDTFLLVYSRARARAFTEPTIRSAFRATGLIPFRREGALRPDAMAPALETSVKGGFPNLLPSPVRAIINAHQKRREIGQGAAIPRLDVVTEEDETLDNFAETNHEEPGIVSVSDQGVQNRSGMFARGPGDSRSEPIIIDDDDNDNGGSKLSEALCTTSARFLISDSPLKSTSRLAAPVIQSVPANLRPDYSALWSGPMNFDAAPKTALAAEVRRLRAELRKAEEVSKIERSINEAANVQLILRDLHLTGLMEQLHTKEEGKVNQKRKRMANKNARWLTGTPFMNELRGVAPEDVQVMSGAVEPVDEQVEAEDMMTIEPLPGETKTKWRERERVDRMAKQKAVLAEWEAKVKECESRGLPAPERPKVRKLFPVPATPPSLKTRKACRRKRVVDDDVEEIDIDMATGEGEEVVEDFEDN